MTNVQDDTAGVYRSEVRWNVCRDMVAGALLAAALLLPWNLRFGVGVPDGATWLFLPLVAATLSSWTGLVIGNLGRRANRSASAATASPDRLRLALNAPYLMVVSGFVVFAYLQVIQVGGSGTVPAGVGPGLLAGLAGALLAAQPVLPNRSQRLPGAIRAIGFTAAGLAITAFAANLYWRTRFPLEALADGTYSVQNVVVIATTVVYGVVALVTVLVGLRWLLADRLSSQLATAALGAATVLGAVLVWVLGVGRDLDAYHGIAQTTSTVSIGFEGYIAWVAAAAIGASWALWSAPPARKVVQDWRDAVGKCLGLIALWCIGSAVLRVFDLGVSASLDMPYSAYDSVALMAFSVVAGAVALWLRFNLSGDRLHPAVLSAAAAVVFVLVICRIVVGIGLAPRILYAAEPQGLQDAVYGNMLAQQITSTFDVVVAWLALIVTIVAVFVLQLGGLRRRAPVAAQPTRPADPVGAAAVAEPEASTTAVPVPAPPTRQLGGIAAPKIARSTDTTPELGAADGRKPKIARVLEESTQRFAAGTTYTGTGPDRPPSQR